MQSIFSLVTYYHATGTSSIMYYNYIATKRTLKRQNKKKVSTCHLDRNNLRQMTENYSDCHIAKGYILDKNKHVLKINLNLRY